MANYDHLAKENYKDCQGRVKSILYGIQSVLEKKYSDIAGGAERETLSTKELKAWNQVVLEIASQLVEVEYENKTNNTFGIEH